MRKWLLIFFLGLVGVLAYFGIQVGSEGESRIEAWVGSELKSIVNAKGRFRLEFTSIDYQAPNRVVLEHLRLSLGDEHPNVPPLVEVEKGTIDLAKIPRWGEPIVLKSVELVKPIVRVESFIAAARAEDATTQSSTTKRSLSSILTLESVEIEDGTISYDDGKGSPLSWNQLDAKMKLESTTGSWHAAHVVIDQSPLMRSDVAAEIDLDSMAARNIKVNAILDLNDPAALQFFTPPLQRMLTKFEVRGRVDLAVTGSVNPLQREQTQLDASLEVKEAHVAVGEYQLPVDRVIASAKMRGNELVVENSLAELLSGTIKSTAKIALDGEKRVQAQASLSRLRLNKLLKTNSENSTTELRGLVNADLRVDSTLPELRKISKNKTDGLVWGSGYVNVTQGRLVRLPVIAQVMTATRQVTKIFTGKNVNRDSFEAQFKLIDKIADISDMLYRGDAIGMRGKGRIAVNGEVDLVVNAGPLERLQETLGAVGKLWGKLTDSLMGYSVKGNLKAPIVRPLLGAG